MSDFSWFSTTKDFLRISPGFQLHRLTLHADKDNTIKFASRGTLERNSHPQIALLWYTRFMRSHTTDSGNYEITWQILTGKSNMSTSVGYSSCPGRTISIGPRIEEKYANWVTIYGHGQHRFQPPVLITCVSSGGLHLCPQYPKHRLRDTDLMVWTI